MMHLPPATITRLPESRIPEAAKLLTSLNPDTPEQVILERLQTIMSTHPHYQLWGAIRDRKLVGVVGVWLGTKVWCGPYLEIDNLVIDPAYRSMGIGALLLERMEELARDKGCTVLTIDSYTTNLSSHRLYHRLGYGIWSFHFVRKIGDFTGASGE